MHILDNPMYNALLTEHASFAVGSGLARRFPAEVAPFGGLESGGEEELRQLFAEGEQAVFVGKCPSELTGWEFVKQFDVLQLIHTKYTSVSGLSSIQMMAEKDVSAMLQLTAMVYPSYFRPGTAQLGGYCGIYSDTELISMAGIRMKLPGYEEISAICTHLDHRGKGLGAAVTRFMIERIKARGNTPFLHTESDNPAQEMYKKLGFEIRATLPVKVLRRTSLPA